MYSLRKKTAAVLLVAVFLPVLVSPAFAEKGGVDIRCWDCGTVFTVPKGQTEGNCPACGATFRMKGASKPSPGEDDGLKVKLDDPVSKVIAEYGRNFIRQQGRMVYKSLGLEFGTERGRVKFISLSAPYSGAIDGVQIGSDFGALTRRFGQVDPEDLAEMKKRLDRYIDASTYRTFLGAFGFPDRAARRFLGQYVRLDPAEKWDFLKPIGNDDRAVLVRFDGAGKVERILLYHVDWDNIPEEFLVFIPYTATKVDFNDPVALYVAYGEHAREDTEHLFVEPETWDEPFFLVLGGEKGVSEVFFHGSSSSMRRRAEFENALKKIRRVYDDE